MSDDLREAIADSVSIPRPLLAHMRRWARRGGSHVVMWNRAGPHGWIAQPVESIDKAFAAAAKRAGLADVSPHTLKHTAVTWAFQKGMTLEDAVDYFSTSDGRTSLRRRTRPLRSSPPPPVTAHDARSDHF